MRDESPHMRVSPSVVSDPSDASASPFAPSPESSEVVLLVEDDELIGDIVTQLLSRITKRVLWARNGAEAAQLFAENESKIALVMLDCCLPDVDGLALCRVLRKLAPKLPVILTSGWDHEAAMATADQGPTVFLPKPFLPSQVERHVRALLGAIA